MNKIYSLVLILLIVILAISSYFFIKEIAENKKENELFEELQEVVQEEEKRSPKIKLQTILKMKQVIYHLKCWKLQFRKHFKNKYRHNWVD